MTSSMSSDYMHTINQLLTDATTQTLLTTTVILGVVYALVNVVNRRQDSYVLPEGAKLPPHIPSSIPFLGHAVSFGKSPIEFLLAAYEKYGPVFSFTMVGKTFTYLLGPEASTVFFESKNENLNAEEVYAKLVTPVFGKGVAYDAPHSLFLEQKKMFKTGLNIARFRQHIPLIEAETVKYFERWGNEGQKDLFKAFSELIILTASRCLHGKEIRSILTEEVAQLYWDLDGGFTQEAWLLPSWLPLPSFRKRDEAHIKVKQIFYKAIEARRQSGREGDDMLQTLIDSTYKEGRHLTDDEISGMLIGLLLAGQHTSSTTSAWMGFFLSKHKDLQDACHEELMKVFGEKSLPDASSSLAEGEDYDDEMNHSALDYDGLKDCVQLERCLKETLRLRPPIMTMMRLCKTPLNVMGYTIPPGHQVCVSPPTNQRLKDSWIDPDEFNPDRFLDTKLAGGGEEKFSYVPFGAGRHRCIGESFAYVQIKTIWATLLRMYEFDLVDGHFPQINVKTMIHTPENPIIKYKKR